MTSFGIHFWQRSLWIASGSGSVSRQIIGTVVIGGMLAATVFGTFLIPAIFIWSRNGPPAKNAALPKCPQHRAPLR